MVKRIHSPNLLDFFGRMMKLGYLGGVTTCIHLGSSPGIKVNVLQSECSVQFLKHPLLPAQTRTTKYSAIMLFRLLATVSLALFVSAQDASSSSSGVETTSDDAPSNSASRACRNPTVRKEWRTFTTAQRTVFLNAVKVFLH